MTRNRGAVDPDKVDAVKLSLPLADLRLPTISRIWRNFAQRADAEGWTAVRFLAAIAEHELSERDRRRIERHLKEAWLLLGKNLASFDFNAVPMISKARVSALATGAGWLDQGANCLIFGPPGASKSHLASALGLALVDDGCRVLFTRTTDLVQRLQIVRRDLALESQLARLNRFHLLILDDLAYVRKDQAETGVPFEPSRRATRGAPCRSPRTSPSAIGTRCSRTKPPPWPPSTASSTTLRSSR